MRNLALVGAMAPMLLLWGCGQSVAGKYRCNGLVVSSLELRADGTLAESGVFFDHRVVGTGTYTADAAHVMVKGDVKVFGDANAVLDEYKDETTYERQGNGDLKWIVVTCKKV